MAQSTRGDWTQQIKVDSEDLGIPFDFNFIKSKSSKAFKASRAICNDIVEN